MRIIVFSERLAPPFDEGIKNVAFNAVQQLSRNHDVVGLTNYGTSVPEHSIQRAGGNRLLLGAELKNAITRFGPDLVVYIPTASATLFSFIRSRVLSRYGKGCPVVMWSLQPRKTSRVDERLMRFMRPELIFVQSTKAADELSRLGCRVSLMPSGVDLDRFTPVSRSARLGLREKYGLEPTGRVVLHIGHIKATRNVEVFSKIQQHQGVQVVLVASTAPHLPQDKCMARSLSERGVRVLTDYIPAVDEMYRLADSYIFPVVSEEGCIGAPLSVLEAMACNLRVVSTRFGLLPQMFASGKGFTFVASEEEIVEHAVGDKEGEVATREMVEPFSWQQICERLVTKALETE